MPVLLAANAAVSESPIAPKISMSESRTYGDLEFGMTFGTDLKDHNSIFHVTKRNVVLFQF